jgi:glutathione S-transferase
MTKKPILYVGNKNYSSWSMRPWLALRWAKIDFEEELVQLGPRGKGPNPSIVAINPSGTLPALQLPDGEIVWDSLAICEWANEAAPQALLWPKDALARAIARSATSEMHAGFGPLRQQFPMNIKRVKHDYTWDAYATANIERIEALLGGLAARFDTDNNGWIFGRRTIVDAFFAPVATRFRTYQVPLSPSLQKWCDTLFSDPDFKVWERDALDETWTIGESDDA